MSPQISTAKAVALKTIQALLHALRGLPINPRASPLNSAFGLLEEKTSPSLLASRKVQLKDLRQGWIKFPFSSDLYLKLQMRGHPLLSLDILSKIRSAANTRLSSRWFYFRKWYNQPGPVKCSFNSATISCMTLSIPLDLQALIIDHISQKHVTPPGGT